MSTYPPNHRTPPKEPASTYQAERVWRTYAEIANERFLAALDRYFRNGGKA